jgi:hypothetical protein
MGLRNAMILVLAAALLLFVGMEQAGNGLAEQYEMAPASAALIPAQAPEPVPPVESAVATPLFAISQHCAAILQTLSRTLLTAAVAFFD